MTAENKVKIESQEVVAKLREWFRAGRGVRRWISAEIGNPRPDYFTPGDVTTPPHWAYPIESSEVLEVGDLEITTLTERLTFRGRCKRVWYGIALQKSTITKIERLKREGEEYWHEYLGDGLAQVHIGSSTTTPFTLEG